jgi:hypothetical protein
MHFSEEIGSPGLGTKVSPLTAEPLATEGEATSGPDDEVNVEELLDAEIGGRPPALGPPPDDEPFEFELPELKF